MVAPLISRTTGLLAPLASKAVSRVGTAIRATGEVQEQGIETLTGQDEKLKDRIPVEFQSAEDIRQDIEFLTDPNLPDQQTIYDNISKEELDLFKEQRKEGAEFGFKRFDKYVTPNKNAQEVENLNRQNAQDYYDNKISFDELKKRNAELMPLKSRELIDDKGNVNIPKAATEEEVLKALGVSGKQSKIIQAKEGKDGIVGLTKTPALKEHIEKGGRVGARLDIPAYEKAGTYVATLHDKEQGGKTLAYASTSVLKNVEFSVSPKAALKIARKKDYSPKSTIARMYGEYVPHKATDAEAYARQAIARNPKDWIQIGMNPDRASYFYDKADGMPVVSADEVIQIGEFILVKGAKKTKPNDPRFRINPKDPNDLRTYQEGGDVKDQTEKMLKKKKGIDNVTTEDLEPTDMIVKETGRPVYKTFAGMHSEIGRSIPIGNKVYNIPSIQNGKVLSEDKLADGIESGEFKPTSVHDSLPEALKESEKRSKSLNIINKTDMPNYMQEGGLLQEGGTVDPVSGNNVPIGSTQEEVRDDIPAQLSEGEFVFPADVVRFIGLDNLMKLRQEAKAGLAKMDRMGQMGNSEEAVEDDTGEFDTDIDDIIGEIEREARMAQPEEEKTEEETPVKKSDEERLGFNIGGLGTKDDSSEKNTEVKTTPITTPALPQSTQSNLLNPLDPKQMEKAFGSFALTRGAVEAAEKKYPNLARKNRQAKAISSTSKDSTQMLSYVSGPENYQDLDMAGAESNIYSQLQNQNNFLKTQGYNYPHQKDLDFIHKHMAKDLSNAGIKDIRQLGYKEEDVVSENVKLVKKGDKYYREVKDPSKPLGQGAYGTKLEAVDPADIRSDVETRKSSRGLGYGMTEDTTGYFAKVKTGSTRILINKDTGEKVVQGKYGGALGYGKPSDDPREGLRWGNSTSVEGMADYMIAFDDNNQALIYPKYEDTKSGFVAPLLTAAAIATTFVAPGVGASIGKAMGLSGKLASTVGNAMVGGTLSKAGGGDFFKGALLASIPSVVSEIVPTSTIDNISKTTNISTKTITSGFEKSVSHGLRNIAEGRSFTDGIDKILLSEGIQGEVVPKIKSFVDNKFTPDIVDNIRNQTFAAAEDFYKQGNQG